MSSETVAPAPSSKWPWIWAILFSISMPAVAVANANGVFTEPLRSILSAAALSLVVPMFISSRRYRRKEFGQLSPVLRAYNRRMVTASVLYVVIALPVFTNYDRIPRESAWPWVLALAAALPLLGMIWALVRYVTDETDEYLRHQAVVAGLIGLALVLVTGTVWGFLETFDLVPHVWAWWVFPGWAIGLGVGQLWMKARST